jgi:xanthine dehydrogenase accessory factor
MNALPERPLRELAARWLTEGREAVVVSVLAHRGSVPREAGTRLLVARDGTLAGTVGGGHLELRAIEAARAWLDRGADARTPLEEDLPLGPALGQCCGGRVRLRWAVLDAAALSAWTVPDARWRVQLHGAGHVARALGAVLAPLDVELDWVDGREDGFDALPFTPPAHWTLRTSEDPVAEVAEAAPGTVFLVMTHRHDLDLRLVQAQLARGDARLVGLIGSATKRARFLHRLEAAGLGPRAQAQLACPLGLPGLEGKAPGEIAIAVAAQLLALPPWVAAPGVPAADGAQPSPASARSPARSCSVTR